MNIVVVLVLLQVSLILAYQMPDDCQFTITAGVRGRGLQLAKRSLFTIEECKAEMVFRNLPAATFHLTQGRKNRCLMMSEKSTKFISKARYTYMEQGVNCKYCWLASSKWW